VTAGPERPAVTIIARMQAEQVIMSLLHPGAGEELIIGSILNQESSPP
jgi:hypothetical protein